MRRCCARSRRGGDAWSAAAETIYTRASDEAFWETESHLAALERLKAGVTTGVSLLGGGNSIMRVDDPVYARRHCDAVVRTGTRSIVAVGPSRPPACLHAPHAGRQRHARHRLRHDVRSVPKHHRRMPRRCRRPDPYRAHVARVRLITTPNSRGTNATSATRPPVTARGARARLTFTQDGHRAGTLAFAHRGSACSARRRSCRTASI